MSELHYQVPIEFWVSEMGDRFEVRYVYVDPYACDHSATFPTPADSTVGALAEKSDLLAGKFGIPLILPLSCCMIEKSDF